VYWGSVEKEPWYLTTNLLDLGMFLQYYRCNMWIWEMYGDMKKYGLNLEIAILRHFKQITQMPLVVVLLYVW
jgi:hypothetical protein